MDVFLFAAKKAASIFIYPVGMCLVIWLVGIILTCTRRYKRAGISAFVASGIVLLILSLPVTGDFLVRSLESHAGTYADPAELSKKGIKNIVVLGCDIRNGKRTPADQVACCSLVRVMEGIRLWKSMPGTRLILSGGNPIKGELSTGAGMAALAADLGVPESSMFIEGDSLDTYDEAVYLRAELGKEPFALVTSAFHMRRSLMIFRSFGLDPVSAPADFSGKWIPNINSFFPEAHGIGRTQKALHEYLGTVAFLLKSLVVRNTSSNVSDGRSGGIGK